MKQKEIIKKLLKNQVGIIPTDTIYGIVTKIGNQKSFDKIFEIKNRSKKRRLPILISSFKQLSFFIKVTSDIKNFLNNLKEPTTIIYKIDNSTKTIAIRLVSWSWLKKIIDKTGPLFATSCNISGKNFTNLKNWEKKVDFINYKKTLSDKPSSFIFFENKRKLR